MSSSARPEHTLPGSERARRFFADELAASDPTIEAAIRREERRQRSQIELIAPKNYMSRAAREALGSILSFTSVEGYPGRRYHAGTINLDAVESLAIERACELFRCSYANLQPHSGTQANQAVFFALLEPGDTVLSMDLNAGGHLSHGLKSNLSGRWFHVVTYGVRSDEGLLDYEQAEELCRTHRPKLIITGGSSYPRAVDFERFRRMADEVGAYLLADIAHFSGLVAGGVHPHPFPHAHVVTTTTNKNLRGPRGGLILADDDELARRLAAAVFPGIQGGPLPEFISAKAVTLGEALRPEFEEYAQAVLDNARTVCDVLASRGYAIVTGGTDTPLVVVDLRPNGLTGDIASDSLERAGIPCNKNLVPGDIEKPSVTSGLRIGTSAVTTRGLRRDEMRHVAGLVADVLDAVGDAEVEAAARGEVEVLCRRFPLYDPEPTT
jgi:glycine hydroxymethyltransferase